MTLSTARIENRLINIVKAPGNPYWLCSTVPIDNITEADTLVKIATGLRTKMKREERHVKWIELSATVLGHRLVIKYHDLWIQLAVVDPRTAKFVRLLGNQNTTVSAFKCNITSLFGVIAELGYDCPPNDDNRNYYTRNLNNGSN